ncbi:MAG TPA: hypothetical protein VD867_05325 [Burkholderiales bacterium]|nr:hypothetical protein [Burkholderiales bacterium]
MADLDTLFAYLMQEGDQEIVVRAVKGTYIHPLMAPTLEQLEVNRPYAVAAARKFNTPVKAVMFSQRRELEAIDPPAPPPPPPPRNSVKRKPKPKPKPKARKK